MASQEARSRKRARAGVPGMWNLRASAAMAALGVAAVVSSSEGCFRLLDEETAVVVLRRSFSRRPQPRAVKRERRWGSVVSTGRLERKRVRVSEGVVESVLVGVWRRM